MTVKQFIDCKSERGDWDMMSAIKFMIRCAPPEELFEINEFVHDAMNKCFAEAIHSSQLSKEYAEMIRMYAHSQGENDMTAIITKNCNKICEFNKWSNPWDVLKGD